MRAGIIAAGDGSRLAHLGVPKPLVRVGGRTLLQRTTELLVSAGVQEIALIVNGSSNEVIAHARSLKLPVNLQLVVKKTPSSMHSLYELRALLLGPSDAPASHCVVCTIDSIIAPSAFVGFVDAVRTAHDADLILAHTDFVDDERPLRVSVDRHGRVTAVGDAAAQSPLVTIGAYGLNARVFDLARDVIAEGGMRLRTLLGRAVTEGFVARSYSVGKAIDVDRPTDIRAADDFLRERV